MFYQIVAVMCSLEVRFTLLGFFSSILRSLQAVGEGSRVILVKKVKDLFCFSGFNVVNVQIQTKD